MEPTEDTSRPQSYLDPSHASDGLSVIAGDVCMVRLSVETLGESIEPSRIFELSFSDEELRREIADTVKQTLGQNFEISSMTVGQGSIKILLIIGTTYYAISRFKNFIESIELMARSIKELTRRHFRNRGHYVSISGGWSPIGMLAQSSSYRPTTRARYAKRQNYRYNLLIWYIIISHAGLLTLACWLIVTQL